MPQGISQARIIGFDNVIKNLNLEILAIEGYSRKGLRECAKFIQRDVETNEPLTPILTDKMRLSWEVHPAHDTPIADRKFGIRFGYSANYALWVHEMVDAKNWTRPGSGPKWLEASINRNHGDLLQIVASETKIP